MISHCDLYISTNSNCLRAIHCLNFLFVVNILTCYIEKNEYVFGIKLCVMHFILIYHLYTIYLNIYHI